MPKPDGTTPEPHYLNGLSADQFLDVLPLYAGVGVSRKLGEQATDEQIQAWAWGIEDTVDNIKKLVAEWRRANAESRNHH